MPPQNRVYCLCCHQWITRQRELQHRKAREMFSGTSQPNTSFQLFNPLPVQSVLVPHGPLSRLTQPPSDESSHVGSGQIHGNLEEFRGGLDDVHAEHVPPLETSLSGHGWHEACEPEFEQLGSWQGGEYMVCDAEITGEDLDEEDDGNGEIKWVDAGLSPWDRLGLGYEMELASIRNSITSSLSPLDQAICKAFSYKVQTNTTDDAFHKIPLAFNPDPPLPPLDDIRLRVAFLSGFTPQIYHCCVKSCCCYTGIYEALDKCPFCEEPRYRAGTTKPRRIFTHIPLIPRLISFAANSNMAKAMQYRAKEHIHKPGTMSDIFDSTNYRTLRERHVQQSDVTFTHKYFEDPRDVALGLSTDGFAPFKRRNMTVWPIILINYNLPPDERFHLKNILVIGVVPGPHKPKDMDSFLRPLFQELTKLGHGVRALDILTSDIFSLRAYLIDGFGDMPAFAMVMRMKGHNAFCPCRMCLITGIQIPNSTAKVYYIPLTQAGHPTIQGQASRIACYDPLALPLRTHTQFLDHANQVDRAATNAQSERLAKAFGIHGRPLLSHLGSLSFPNSFPFDFMHLVWENVVKTLVLLWSGDFKGLDTGIGSYKISPAVWAKIGELTSSSGSTIPSAYGNRVPNIASDKGHMTAESWSFWAQYIAPVLLRNRFEHIKYYRHFISLVRLLNICLQFEITDEEIETLQIGFANWVKDYERLYYQFNFERLGTCTLPIHGLLHIADSIKAAGPVWCYWAFPMERYCGTLRPGIRNRRYPFASLDRFVLETTQLQQIQLTYNCPGLSLSVPKPETEGYIAPLYSAFRLLPACSDEPITQHIRSIAAALVTRYRLPMNVVNRALKKAKIDRWAKVKRIDSSEGDIMYASSMLKSGTDDRRDATHIRYELLVDIYARNQRRTPEFKIVTCYGQLQNIYRIELSDPRCVALLKLPTPTTLILAGIRSCNLHHPDTELRGLDIHFFSDYGMYDVVDIVCVQALVGRVNAGDGLWGIIDRNGMLARAVFDVDANDTQENTEGDNDE